MASPEERPARTSSRSAAKPSNGDEIQERYLRRAISEINELGDELLALGDELHVPVLGSGHPLGDVFLLKHRPTPSEIQEGVAFFGRSGQALLKSLQRLDVDPLAIYGTNCLKFGTEDPADARRWLTRELHIVQPRLVVAMGDETVAFLAALEFPLSRAARCGTRGRASAVHADDRGARHARHRRVARRAVGEDELLERLQDARHVVGRAPAVLSGRRAARALAGLLVALVAWDALATELPGVSDGLDVALVALVLIPAAFSVAWLLLPFADARGLLPCGLGLVGALRPARSRRAGRGVQRREARRSGAPRALVPAALRRAVVGRARGGPDPLGRHLLRLSRADARGRGAAPGRVRASGGRVLPARRARRRANRASGRVLLRALPRRVCAIRPEGRGDLGRDDGLPLAHPGRDVRVRRRGATGPAGHRARLRPPQPRPALAGAPRAERPQRQRG